MSAAETDDLRPLRIRLIGETYHPVIGGGETQARALAEGLPAQGVVVSVLTRRSDPVFPARETINGVEVRRLGPSGAGQLKKWAMLPGLFLFLLREGRRDDAFLVCGFRVLGIAAMAAGLATGRPVVLKADNTGEMSGSYFRDGLANLGLGWARGAIDRLVRLRNRLFRRADAFVALSSAMQAEFEAACAPSARIVRIPNSVDLARFAPPKGGSFASTRAKARAAIGLPAEGPVVLFVGRLLETKGVLDLVRAWASVAPDHPSARLVIVGGGGGTMHDCEAAMHALIDSGGLRGSVLTPGFARNVEDYVRAADIFAFPTRDEAFGIALVEAMTAGLAVISTQVGGLGDVFTHGIDGIAIAPQDADGLASALRRLLDDPALRARLGAAASARAAARFGTDAVLARYADLLRETIAARSGNPSPATIRKVPRGA